MMKVKYNNKLVFNLPNEYNVDERLNLVNQILESYTAYFTYTKDQDTRYDDNIRRVLDGFAYYLVTSKKMADNGKALNNDKEIMRKRKIDNRKRTEIHLHDSIAYSSTYDGI